MIQIARFDQLGSGVLNIHKYWPLYAPGTEPVFRETRHGFELVLPLPESAAEAESGPESKTRHPPEVTAQDTAQVAGQVAMQVEDQVTRPESRPESRLESKLAARVVTFLQSGPKGKAELAGWLGHASVSGELKKQVLHLLAAGLIERTIPDKPNSRLQKYRLTEKGRLAAGKGKA